MNPVLFDTHLHLTPDDDAVELLAKARAVGVKHFVAAAGDFEDAVRAVAVACENDDLFATVGLHPHEARLFADDLVRYRRLAEHEQVVAIGEIGLDYYYDHSPRDVQRRVFSAFLTLAGEMRLPSVIHCRDAHDDCLAILRDTLAPGQSFVVHSYTGTPEWAEEALALGAMFSFNGMVTFKKADNIRAALRAVPLDCLLLETDSPYLAPVPHRGKRNQPAYVADVARGVADVLDLPFADIAQRTTDNALRFFGRS